MAKNRSQTTHFSLSEEAFILSSLKEVTKVWARGTGLATFNLNSADGFANLQLGFSLGRPTDPHLHVEPGDPHHLPTQDHHRHQPRKRRKKSPARLAKDRARAEQHRARLQSEEAAVSSCTEEQTEPVSQDVALPFTGKLLPLWGKSRISATASAAPTLPQPTPPTSASTAPVATPPTGAPPRTFCPMKNKDVTTPRRYVDLHCVKKHLFSPPPSKPQSSPASTPFKLDYKKKEDEKWTRLFS